VPLIVAGKFFTLQTGEPYTLIESSDFSLFKRFLDREHIEPILEQRAGLGFNLLRVWLLNKSVVGSRNPQHDEGIHPDQYGDFYVRLTEFCGLCESHGLRLEVTAFTSTSDKPGDPGLMPSEMDQRNHWDRTQDAVRGLPNVLLELVNEADQYNNAPTATLSRAGGILCSRGSNGSDAIPPGHNDPWDYELYHIIGNEWQRKTGHNAMEWADQSGRPCWTGETQRYPDKETSTTRAYDAAAGSALLCAGVCFHSQGGKYSRLFDAVELAAAEATVAGALSVPLEFQRGAYQRHDDRNGGPDNVIRSYSRTLGDGRRHYVDIRA
jgi:hypothetical protein